MESQEIYRVGNSQMTCGSSSSVGEQWHADLNKQILAAGKFWEKRENLLPAPSSFMIAYTYVLSRRKALKLP